MRPTRVDYHPENEPANRATCQLSYAKMISGAILQNKGWLGKLYYRDHPCAAYYDDFAAEQRGNGVETARPTNTQMSRPACEVLYDRMITEGAKAPVYFGSLFNSKTPCGFYFARFAEEQARPWYKKHHDYKKGVKKTHT